MTINTDNTTAACRSVSVSEYLDGYEFRGDGGDYTPDANEKELIEDAIEGYLSTLQDQASAPRSASAGASPGVDLSSATKSVASLYALGEAPPQIRIDQDAGIVTDEMVTAAMRAFEPMSSVLRYREKDKWHSCDIMAMRDALRAALASNPLEGKGIQSRTEQASSGVRSTKQREG